MNYFFTSVLQLLLPFSLLSGLLWASQLWPAQRNIPDKALHWLSLTALCVGFLLWQLLTPNQTLKLALSLLYASVLLFSLIAAPLNRRILLYLAQIGLLLFCGIFWAQNPNLSAITTTEIINTDFILNLFTIATALLFCLLAANWIAVLLAQSQHALHYLRMLAIVLLIFWLLLPLSGQILLSLIKLQLVDLDKGLLSFVAKTLNLTLYNNYLIAIIILGITLLFWVKVQKPRRHAVKQQHDLIEKRQKTARYRQARRITLSGLILALIVISAQCYWDNIASQPPRLSEATPVTLSDNDQIHIDIKQVSDGKLHRFVWISDEGKAVRFFIINRLSDRLSLGVVFDACLLCGDQGYVMQGNQVVCVACGVHMFIPSIGKPGGCNPVPINDWQQTETQVIIDKKSLEEGLNYFSTIVKLDVTDPVDGTKLINTEAKFKYSYAGKSYFFASEQNLNQFRDNPERYLTKHKQRESTEE
ncbi:Fe-S-containing protein [Testudinibacter aquarius]|uniref:DUF2318 domain-containing protein n=1 Tax=Testudinibacter aquarius TaxID=1524974 RepID=A0A4R3Y2W8_9PAST|nr:Fe-S-containing protein [Testudinibacter aquarius]KAE9530436.1 hypothetical protein A1D24_06260 [Testudinibacter aquarius]TCV86040.1 putative membrane protein [Testudinibacter aquarius]TNG92834.1 DUF2318 domain-containing protein [Testudinibacter aquarius]